MVHVVDTDEELMWTDDHNPPVPTTQWKQGQQIEYTRTVFVPIYPYVGEASIEVGLYSTTNQKRLPLAGDDVGKRAYKVGRLQLTPQTENVFTVFKDGWHPAEVAEHNASVEWQWTKKQATLSFKNPRKDSVFYLELDNPGTVQRAPAGAGEPRGTGGRSVHARPEAGRASEDSPVGGPAWVGRHGGTRGVGRQNVRPGIARPQQQRPERARGAGVPCICRREVDETHPSLRVLGVLCDDHAWRMARARRIGFLRVGPQSVGQGPSRRGRLARARAARRRRNRLRALGHRAHRARRSAVSRTRGTLGDRPDWKSALNRPPRPFRPTPRSSTRLPPTRASTRSWSGP